MPVDNGEDARSSLSLQRHNDVTPMQVTMGEGDSDIVGELWAHRMGRIVQSTVTGVRQVREPVMEGWNAGEGASRGRAAAGEYDIEKWLAPNVAYIVLFWVLNSDQTR